MLPHSCFRCGRPLESGERSFCSKRCQALTFGELGTLENPHQWRQYDYATFDPEDELYGEYDCDPEISSREGYQIHGWRLNGEEDWDEDDECRVQRTQDNERPPVTAAEKLSSNRDRAEEQIGSNLAVPIDAIGSHGTRTESEVARLRAILQRIVGRYERERGCRSDPEAAVMLAWAMCSDAREGLQEGAAPLPAHISQSSQ